MGGRDHETDHDGECFPDCRECKLKKLEEKIRKYSEQSQVVNCTLIHRDDRTPMFYADGDTGVITANLDGYAIIPIEMWQHKDDTDDR